MNIDNMNSNKLINENSSNKSDSLFVILEDVFKIAFLRLGLGSGTKVLLTDATKAEFGDFQVNGVMAGAKILKQNPRQLAAQVIDIVTPLLQGIAAKIELAGAGFINIKLEDIYLADYLMNGVRCLPQNSTIIIDMSGPNLAKEMHVGHLRSTIIGDAIARMYQYLGYNVIRQNHVGDWGTQFGMLIAYLEDELKAASIDIVDEVNLYEFLPSLSDLEEFYRLAKVKFDTDIKFSNLARSYVVVLQNWQNNGSLGLRVYKLWQLIRKISLNHCQEVYDLLGVKLDATNVVGESFYNDRLQLIIDKLKQKNLITQSDGASCIFFKEHELGGLETTPLIVQKQDGGFLYSTTDLAAIDYRVHSLAADKIIYVVDNRQSLHFKQVFCVAKLSELVNIDTILEHSGFGTMMDESGRPFKTRTGGTVKLIDLIYEAFNRAEAAINERHPEWNQATDKAIAHKLAIAAIKYADLSKNRNSDYIFSLDKMLAFDGNTAPYLLYAYTRIRSILRRADLIDEKDMLLVGVMSSPIIISVAIEHQLALHLAKFIDIVKVSAHECYPHYLCQYLYNLSALFMQFYEECPIVKADLENIRQSRLHLAGLTATTLKLGLDLLGIDVVEKM